MKLLPSFTPRQREVTVQLFGNSVILLVFLVCLKLHKAASDLAAALLLLSWLLPTFYLVVRIYTSAETLTDERDRQIESTGIRDGYALFAFGIFAILLYGGTSAFQLNALIVLWLVSRIAADAKQLRLYAGHTSWLPDSFREALLLRRLNRIENPTPRQIKMATRYMERQRRREGK